MRNLSATLALCTLLSASNARGEKIVLDAGHGGSDKGATVDGVRESDIALAITKSLKGLLEKNGHSVHLTRSSDETLALEDRAQKANSQRPDLFLSIHLNSSTDPRAQGKEFYFQNQLPADEEAMLLASRENSESNETSDVAATPRSTLERAGDRSASRIERAGLRRAEAAQAPEIDADQISPLARIDLKRILEDLTRNERVRRSSLAAIELERAWSLSGSDIKGRATGRSVRQAPFFLVTHVAAPSVLVEVGFLSHKREGQKLQTAEYQLALAQSLASGVDSYLKRVRERPQAH